MRVEAMIYGDRDLTTPERGLVTPNNNVMHTKRRICVYLEWVVTRRRSVITAVIPLPNLQC